MVERSHLGTSTHRRWHGRRKVSGYITPGGRISQGVLRAAVVTVEVLEEGTTEHPARAEANGRQIRSWVPSTDGYKPILKLVRVKKWLVLGNSDWYASELKHSFV